MKSGDTKLPKEQQKFGGVVSWLKALMFVETVSMKKPKSLQCTFGCTHVLFMGEATRWCQKAASVGEGVG